MILEKGHKTLSTAIIDVHDSMGRPLSKNRVSKLEPNSTRPWSVPAQWVSLEEAFTQPGVLAGQIIC